MNREQWVFLGMCLSLALTLFAGLQLRPVAPAMSLAWGKTDRPEPTAVCVPAAGLSDLMGEARINPFAPPWSAPVDTEGAKVTEEPPSETIDLPKDSPNDRPRNSRTISNLTPADLGVTRMATIQVAGRPLQALLHLPDGRELVLEEGGGFRVQTVKWGELQAQVVEIAADCVVVRAGERWVRIP